MTDRRTREPVRCLIAGCPHTGHWPRGYCPPHHAQVVEQLAAAIHRHRHPEPDPASSAGGLLSDPLGSVVLPSRTPAPHPAPVDNRESRALGRHP